MSNTSELEKIFLLTLVQNAKCYCITRQENPEFLGEFDGGAKTTSNSGVISFEYVEIWERYAQYVSSLTNKQTKWMKCQVTGNQIKEEKLEICIKSVYRYERKKGKTREITSFLSILSDFQQIQVKFYWWSNEVKPWKFEKKITKIIVRLTRERKKGRRNPVEFEWFPANPSQILPTFCHGTKVKPWKIWRKNLQIYRSFDGREEERKEENSLTNKQTNKESFKK